MKYYVLKNSIYENPINPAMLQVAGIKTLRVNKQINPRPY